MIILVDFCCFDIKSLKNIKFFGFSQNIQLKGLQLFWLSIRTSTHRPPVVWFEMNKHTKTTQHELSSKSSKSIWNWSESTKHFLKRPLWDVAHRSKYVSGSLWWDVTDVIKKRFVNSRETIKKIGVLFWSEMKKFSREMNLKKIWKSLFAWTFTWDWLRVPHLARKYLLGNSSQSMIWTKIDDDSNDMLDTWFECLTFLIMIIFENLLILLTFWWLPSNWCIDLRKLEVSILWKCMRNQNMCHRTSQQ